MFADYEFPDELPPPVLGEINKETYMDYKAERDA